MRTSVATVVLLAALTTAGCAKVPTPGIYKLDIQQGNVVTEDMLARLEAGMEKRKVRFLLGTPLVTDVFDPNRWDYIYSFQEGGGERVQRHIVAVFEEERLVRLEGDVLPSAFAGVVEEAPERVVTVPDQPPPSIFSRFTRVFENDERMPLERKPVEDEEEEEGGLFGGWFADDGQPDAQAGNQRRALDSEAPQLTPPPPSAGSLGASQDEETPGDAEEVGDTEEIDDTAAAEEAGDRADEVGFFERLSDKFGLEPPPPGTGDARN